MANPPPLKKENQEIKKPVEETGFPVKPEIRWDFKKKQDWFLKYKIRKKNTQPIAMPAVGLKIYASLCKVILAQKVKIARREV